MAQLRDISGNRFGSLVALRPDGRDSTGKTKWLCACDCGKFSSPTMLNLTKGISASCGCRKHAPSKRRVDLTGRRFGRLLAVEAYGGKAWKCLCDCGNEKITATVNLVHEKTKSCGCLSACNDARKSEVMRERNRVQHSGWPQKVRMDAGGVCDACGGGEHLHAHHILPFATNPQLRTDPENGSLLCHACHWEVHRRINKGALPGVALIGVISSKKPYMRDLIDLVMRGCAEDLRKVIHYAQLALELQYGEKSC